MNGWRGPGYRQNTFHFSYALNHANSLKNFHAFTSSTFPKLKQNFFIWRKWMMVPVRTLSLSLTVCIYVYDLNWRIFLIEICIMHYIVCLTCIIKYYRNLKFILCASVCVCMLVDGCVCKSKCKTIPNPIN